MQDVPVLYHYTDANGLCGIINDNCLWATATQFSNDLTEIEYAASIAQSVIEKTWQGKRNLGLWEEFLSDRVRGVFAPPLSAFNQPFLFSLCQNGDLLSQWRAYGLRSRFSLAFKPLWTGESVPLRCENSFRTLLRKVIYDPAHQKARLRFILKRLIKLVKGFPSKPTAAEERSIHAEMSLILILEMTDWACTFKHRAFSEEQEWRVITFPKFGFLFEAESEGLDAIMVRPKAELLVPYIILRPTSKQLPLVEIRCGPSRFQEQSARAVNILLRKTGYATIPITRSEIPLLV